MPKPSNSDAYPIITVGLDGTMIVTVKGNLETAVMTYGWRAAAAFAEEVRLAAKMARKISDARSSAPAAVEKEGK